MIVHFKNYFATGSGFTSITNGYTIRQISIPKMDLGVLIRGGFWLNETLKLPNNQKDIKYHIPGSNIVGVELEQKEYYENNS